MLINDKTILTQDTPLSKLSLIPYLACHVPKYHEWMTDPDLLNKTASEPLTLAQEYGMQQSWLTDPYKLTFILVWSEMPMNYVPNSDSTQYKYLNTLGGMIGDVNLFFHSYNQPDSLQYHTAEIEIMIAEPKARHLGFAQMALAWIMSYARQKITNDDQNGTLFVPKVQRFLAIISQTNLASQNLFLNKLQFQLFKTVNVFHQVHLDWYWPNDSQWPFLQIPKYQTIYLK